MNFYSTISPIENEEFFKYWECSERFNPNRDKNSTDRLEKYKQRKLSVLYIEIDKLETFQKIILPYHNANHHFFKTSVGGSTIEEFLSKYNFAHLNDNSSNDCINRINFQIYCFKNRLIYNPSFYEGFFMYVTEEADPDLGQNGRNGNFLYAGNFHQFASIGLLIQIDGFKPLRLYLCTNAP
jgi:hypothetical protein